MNERILELLKDLVSIDSLTSSEREREAAEYIYNFLEKIPYFKKNPELFGKREIPADPFKRALVYGLVRGKTDKTVILTGHYDVVDSEDYGPARAYAFDIERLPDRLRLLDIDEESKRDIESGEWIFGRGAADMKAGLAVCMEHLREYASNPGEGSLLFLAVPDEESYSVGMRSAVELLLELRRRHALLYRLLIDAEPSRRADGAQVLSVGTGGKCLPVILVQGKKAHIRSCFDGLNPIGVLAKIFFATELSAECIDVYEGEAAPPPTWAFFKDMKEIYDASVPLQAAGYLSALGFYTTPGQILERLCAIARTAFADYLSEMRGHYEDYRAKSAFEIRDFHMRPRVFSFSELKAKCAQEDAAGFPPFYEALYGDIAKKLQAKALNYPQATILAMRELLSFARITSPCAVIGFAPPLYPPMLSERLPGREREAVRCFERLRSDSRELYGIDMVKEYYSVGLSDCSYCAVDSAFAGEDVYSENTPLWGELYNIDFSAIRRLNVPAVLFGPYGKDFHQCTERVSRFDLCERIPELMRRVCAFVFEQ